MVWFVLGIIVLVAGIAASIMLLEGRTRLLGVVGAIIVGVALILPSMLYKVDVGQAKVLKSISGSIISSDTTTGFSFKAPWASTVRYDIRNQQVIFQSSGEGMPSNANGPQITIQDKEGVSANIDITVRYSIDPAEVEQVHSKYQTQQNFVSRFIENDIRAGVRSIPASYTTLGLLGSRVKVEAEIKEYLEKRWAKSGVLVESVSLQEIRYPDEVKKRFSDAQNARTDVEKARAELEATKVSAEQQVVEAKAAAEANKLLDSSLTPEIIQYKQLQTLEKIGAAGNTVVVPQGSTPFIQVPPNTNSAPAPTKDVGKK